MNKPKSKVWFYLSPNQMDAMIPLWDQVEQAYKDGKPGVILLNPHHRDNGIRGDFFPEKYAKRIQKILEEMADEQG